MLQFRSVWIAFVATALALTASCGGGASAGPTSPGNGGNNNGNGTTAITVADDYYTPPTTRVLAGTTVTWTWTGANAHSVTFDDGTTSATQATGTYSRSFGAAGTYSYHCKIHGTAMSGTVTVQ
jgi:plastocyanin